MDYYGGRHGERTSNSARLQSKTLADKQTAFDAELTAVEAALLWYEDNHTTHPPPHHSFRLPKRHRSIRTLRSWTGTANGQIDPEESGQHPPRQGRSANIVWVKGHIGIPGNEKADKLAGQAAGRVALPPQIAHLERPRWNGTRTRNTTEKMKSHPQRRRSPAWMALTTPLPGPRRR
jgi:hypothetical protein